MVIKSKPDLDREWVLLMLDAKKLNLSLEEIRHYLQQASILNKCCPQELQSD